MYVSQLTSVTEKLHHAVYKLSLELADGNRENIISAAHIVLAAIKEQAPSRSDNTYPIRAYAENLKRCGSLDMSRLVLNLLQGRFFEDPTPFIERSLNKIHADAKKHNKANKPVFADELV